LAAEPEAWPPVLPLGGLAPAPPFPVDALPAVARNLVTEAADALDGPADYVGHAALAVAGAAAGAAVELEVKPGWRERACFYAALVGTSGNSKTPSLQLVARPVYAAQEALHVAYEQDLREFEGERRAWIARGRQGDEPRRPLLPRLHSSDVTTACVAQLLVENPRGLLVLRDELCGWLSSLGEYHRGASGDRQRWLSIWSGDPVAVDRCGAPAPRMMYRPFVAVLGGMVPTDLRHFLATRRGRGANALGDDDGLMARFTFSFPDSRQVGAFHTRSVLGATLAAWANVLQRLRRVPMLGAQGGALRPNIVQFAPAGLEVFADYCNRLAKELNGEDFPEELRAAWLKSRSQGARLALAVHLLRCAEAATADDGLAIDSEVDAASMAAAVRLGDYFRGMYRRVVSSATDDQAGQRVAAILHWLVRPREERITRFKRWHVLQQLSRSRFQGVVDVAPALELLVQNHYLRIVHPGQQRGRPGRPQEVSYEVNPAIYRDRGLVPPDERDEQGRGGQ
jgi:hypothetical protein